MPECYCDGLHKIQIMAWGKVPIKRTLMEWFDLISDHHMRAIASQKVIVVCFWLAINILRACDETFIPFSIDYQHFFMNTCGTKSWWLKLWM